MNMKNKIYEITRRQIIKNAAFTTGALSIPFAFPFTEFAYGQAGEKATLVVIYLRGGYNALFTSADSFVGNNDFGVNANNMLDLGNGLIVDNSWSALGQFAQTHMATVGVRHGIANHGGARQANFTDKDGQWAPLSLAAGLGGSGAIKTANIGQDTPVNINGTVQGVSLQTVTDMGPAVDAIGGGAPDPTMPDRAIAALAVKGSMNMSNASLEGNPASLDSVRNGFSTAIETLSTPVKPFSLAEMQTAYDIGQNTAVNSFSSKMAAAELMVRADTNVILVSDNGWDTHGDRDGQRVRQKMQNDILPGLRAFTDRMMDPAGDGATNRNVVVTIMGDFARSLPGSDHAAVLSATVIGKYVNTGTTGRVNANVGLVQGSPALDGFWGYLTATLKGSTSLIQAMGGNPHADLLL